VRLWAACMHLDYAQVGAVFAQKGQPVDKEKQAKTDLVRAGGSLHLLKWTRGPLTHLL